MARLAPAGMIFIPCKDGISHNEIEDTKPKRIAVGGKYLLTEKYFIDEFVNADAIAVGLSASAPGNVAFQLGRVMLQRIDALLKGRRSFAFETTLASKSFTRLIVRAQSSGYLATVLCVALPSAQLAKRRVARRVKEGSTPSSTTLLSADYTACWRI